MSLAIDNSAYDSDADSNSQSLLQCLTRPFSTSKATRKVPITIPSDEAFLHQLEFPPRTKLREERPQSPELITISSDSSDTDESSEDEEGVDLLEAPLDSDGEQEGATELYTNVRSIEKAVKELKMLLKNKGHKISNIQLPIKYGNRKVYQCYYCTRPRTRQDIFCSNHYPNGQFDDPRVLAAFLGESAPHIPKRKWKPRNWGGLRDKLNTIQHHVEELETNIQELEKEEVQNLEYI